MNKLRVFTSFSGYDSQCLALDNEQWKDIVGYEGQYQVSNCGRVKSLSHKTLITLPNGTKYYRTFKGRILKTKKDKYGYLFVSLNNGNNTYKVHRLVAMAFCEGYSYNKQVNHKDENKENNCANNLEWCTSKYNNQYGTHAQRSGIKHRKSIIQYSIVGECLNVFESLKAAEQYLNIKGASTPICRCCKGIVKQAYGYKWKYAI